MAVCRLTPDDYHYNHAPLSGTVAAHYNIDGACHACNPGAVVQMVTPYSKNTRVVTVFDTDVKGGSQVGLVAMIEIVALMIGAICQCYSDIRYDRPKALQKGMFIRRGQPKSLYRPGSSTTVLVFQKGRVIFDKDLIANRNRRDVSSRFALGFQLPLVETRVRVREAIAKAV